MLSPMEEVDQRSEDAGFKEIRQELIDLGLWEVGMSTRDMMDVIAVVRDSKQSAEEEQSFREAIKNCNILEPEVKGVLRRRYIATTDRRLPWSILPQNLKMSQKKQIILKYWQALSRTQHARAKFNTNFAPWPAPIEVPRETYTFRSLRSTRSGRCAPKYTNSDDSDLEDTTCSRKIRRKRSITLQNSNEISKPTITEIRSTEKRKHPTDDSLATASPVIARRETKSSSPEVETITVEAEIHREGSPVLQSSSKYPVVFPPSPEEEEETRASIKRIKKTISS